MITGEGLLGKIIIAIVGKAASKLAGLTVGNRRPVAKALTKLYFATVQLDEITDHFLEICERFSKGQNPSQALHIAIKSQAQTIDAASNTFSELSDELYDALEILDPILANTLSFLKTGKENFLWFLSITFDVSSEGSELKARIGIPNARILSVDFQDVYNTCAGKHESGEKYYWPEGVFDYFNDFEILDITFVEPEAAAELISMLFHQNELLKQARESLRILLRDNLTLEEVFFAGK